MATKIMELTPTADTYVHSGWTGTNYGGSSTLDLGEFGTYTNVTSEVLFQFDVSTIPKGAKIIKASLELYSTALRYADNMISAPLVRNNSPWIENSVLWGTRPTAKGYTTYGITIPYTGFRALNTWWKWDISQIVRDWINGVALNYGVSVQINMNGHDYGRGGARFHSRESSNTALRPKLVIEYVPNKFLVEDGTDIKTYNSTTKLWSIIGTSPVTEEMFNTHGTENVLFSKEAIASLPSSVKLLCLSPYATLRSKTTAVPYPQLVTQTDDVSIASIDALEQLYVKRTEQWGGKIRMAVSFNSGALWHIWDTTGDIHDWLAIPLTKENLAAKGMTPDVFSAVSKEDWEKIRNGSTKIRFAYYLSIDSLTDIAAIDEVVSLVQLTGEWTHYNADISYSNHDVLIHLYQNGTYKINYVE